MVHAYLKEFGRVESRSLGEGNHRRIQVYPMGVTPPESGEREERGRSRRPAASRRRPFGAGGASERGIVRSGVSVRSGVHVRSAVRVRENGERPERAEAARRRRSTG